MEGESRVCLACGAGYEPGARFCAQCGRPLAEEEPVASARTPPRIFGAVSPDALFVAACVFLVFAAIALVGGSWLVGVALLAPALALLVLFVSADTSKSVVARTSVKVAYRARGWAGLGGRAVGAWSGAGRSVLRLRRESRTLRRERERAQVALGDATFREDEEAVGALRTRMHAIDRELAEREQARAAALEAARRRVDDERAGAQRTRQLSVERPGPGGRSSDN